MKKSVWFVLTAAIIWGSMGIFTNTLMEWGFTAVQNAFFREIFAGVILFIYLLITDRKKLKISLKDLPIIIVTAIVCMVLYNICYINAIKLTSMSIASVLLYSAPVFVTLFSAIIFKEKITAKKLLSLFFAVTGCVLVSGILMGLDSINVIGVLYGIGSGFTYGLYSIFSKFALKRMHILTFTMYIFLISAIILLPFSNVTSIPSIISGKVYAVPFIILFSVITNIIPYVSYTTGLKNLEACKASILATIEPVSATIFGFIVFHQKITVMSLCGISFVILSSVLLNINIKHHPHKIATRAS